MPRPSKISREAPAIRKLIADLRGEGRTIDEILAKLRELSVNVKRSALGRHVKQIDAIAKDILRSRAVAEALVERLGDKESRQAQLNIQLLHSQVMKLAAAGEDGKPVMLAPDEAMMLGRTLRDISIAAKNDAELTLKLRRELAAEAAKVMKSEGRKRGLSEGTIREIEERILGIAR